MADIPLVIAPVETTVTGSGAITPGLAALLDSSGGALTLTLANGNYVGQRTLVVMTDASNESTLSVTNHKVAVPLVGTFNAMNESWLLIWLGLVWDTIYATCTF